MITFDSNIALGTMLHALVVCGLILWVNHKGVKHLKRTVRLLERICKHHNIVTDENECTSNQR